MYVCINSPRNVQSHSVSLGIAMLSLPDTAMLDIVVKCSASLCGHFMCNSVLCVVSPSSTYKLPRLQSP